MRDRRTEKCQDGIAHQSRNKAFVFIDRADHVFEGIVHDLCPFFRIKLFRRSS